MIDEMRHDNRRGGCRVHGRCLRYETGRGHCCEHLVCFCSGFRILPDSLESWCFQIESDVGQART